MAYRIVKWVMAAAAVLYLALVLLVPGLAGLKSNVLAWIVYGAYVLVTAMVWGMSSKANRTIGEGIDKDKLREETWITQEAELSKSRWSSV